MLIFWTNNERNEMAYLLVGSSLTKVEHKHGICCLSQGVGIICGCSCVSTVILYDWLSHTSVDSVLELLTLLLLAQSLHCVFRSGCYRLSDIQSFRND